ncbi:hypothetical protein ACFX1X_046223 [Malus domestica]
MSSSRSFRFKPNLMSAGEAVVQGKGGESGDEGKEVGFGSGLDPCEVLDGEFEKGGVNIEPEDGRLEAEVEEGDAALVIASGVDEVGAGRLGGEK